jgi:hypothetical protein
MRAVFQPFRLYRRVTTGSDEHLDRLARRLRDNRQPRPADLLDLLPKLVRRDSRHASRFVADDDLRPRLAVLDEIRFSGCAASNQER